MKLTKTLLNFFEIEKFKQLGFGKKLAVSGLAALPAFTIFGIIASPFVFKGAVWLFSRNVTVKKYSHVSQVASPILPNASSNGKFLLPEILHTKEHSGIHQFPVLDQKKAQNGNESCGYHAWKNALLGLALTSSPRASIASYLNDKKFFNDSVFPFIPNIGSGNDVTIVDLEAATRKLETNPPEELQPLAEALAGNPQSLSIMVTEGDVFSYDETTLHNLIDLVEVYDQDGPWTHAIIIGSQGHWTTLFLQKTEENTLVWSGCDSWHNQTDVLAHHQMLIEEALNNREKTLQDAFQYAVGDMLERKKNWFFEDSTLQNPKDFELLIGNREYAARFTRRIEAGFDFLSRLDLLEDPFYQGSIAILKIAAKFYADNLDASDMSVQKAKMQEIFDSI